MIFFTRKFFLVEIVNLYVPKKCYAKLIFGISTGSKARYRPGWQETILKYNISIQYTFYENIYVNKCILCITCSLLALSGQTYYVFHCIFLNWWLQHASMTYKQSSDVFISSHTCMSSLWCFSTYESGLVSEGYISYEWRESVENYFPLRVLFH